jgi:hypothetical protein
MKSAFYLRELEGVAPRSRQVKERADLASCVSHWSYWVSPDELPAVLKLTSDCLSSRAEILCKGAEMKYARAVRAAALTWPRRYGRWDVVAAALR